MNIDELREGGRGNEKGGSFKKPSTINLKGPHILSLYVDLFSNPKALRKYQSL